MNSVFKLRSVLAVHSPMARKITTSHLGSAHSNTQRPFIYRRASKIPQTGTNQYSRTFPLILLAATVLLVCYSAVHAHDSSTEPGIFDHSEAGQADLSDQLKQERRPQQSVRMASSRGGKWSAVTEWPLLAVHASLLPNGKVLAWDATPDDFDEDPHTASSYTTRVTVWDPLLGTHTQANNDTDTDLFCAGSAHLWDGRVPVSYTHLTLPTTPYV